MDEVRSIWFTLFFMGTIVFFMLCFGGCTLSFQNISTHGTAEDVVDENLKTDPTVEAPITVPLPKTLI